MQAHTAPTKLMHKMPKEATTQMQKVAKTTKAEFDYGRTTKAELDYGRTWRLI